MARHYIKRPTDRQLAAWFANQPSGDYTCADCGKVASDYYVQPQHPYYAEGHEGIARCSDCIARINQQMRLPRCEMPGCQHRGTWKLLGFVLCGPHKNRAMDRLNHVTTKP